MVVASTPVAVLEARLAEAEQAYHRLMTGTSVVELRDQNGETIKYGASSRSALAAYINDLKTQLGLICPGSRGPMKVWF